MSTPEVRAGLEFRVSGRTLSGVVLRYGDVSPEHRERFVPGAFAPVPDVPLNVQHDAKMRVLDPGAFALTDSERELRIRAELSPGSAALELVRRGAFERLQRGIPRAGRTARGRSADHRASGACRDRPS